MNAFESIEPSTVLSGRGDWLDAELVARLSRRPLEGIETEFPHYQGSIDAETVARPTERHPVFYGGFDWHSSVHSHWSLCRLLRVCDEHPAEAEFTRSVARRLTPETVAREVAYFEENESFERPYGWGWFLRLAAELHLWDDDPADEWRGLLGPLEARIVTLVESVLLARERPIRVGTHGNTAFALGCVLDYARVIGDDSLAAAAAETSRELFAADRDYPVEYEPLGWDFLSPALVEADLMRRVLDGDAFETWLDGFLPDVRAGPSDTISKPVEVRPGTDDGAELHLVGLNLSRAWCLAGVAAALRSRDRRTVATLERSAVRHARCGLKRAFTDEYAGAHWLSSFAVYLLTRNEGGIAPA
jgi:hypothetical protein